MKIRFKVDIKNPGKRSCYTKVTDIESFNSVNFQIWLSKNFENFIKENKDNFTDETEVEIEYTDLDSNNTYKYIVNFKNNLYEFYMNNKKVEIMSLNDLFNCIFGLNDVIKDLNLNDNLKEDEKCVNESCCSGEPCCDDQMTGQKVTLKDMVMDEFNDRYVEECDDAFIETLKDAILFKISNGDFMFVESLNPLIEYRNQSGKKPIGIIINVSNLNFNDVKFDISRPIKEYLIGEGFSDVLFSKNKNHNELACIF